MQTPEPQSQNHLEKQEQRQPDNTNAIVKPANVGMSGIFQDLIIWGGLLCGFVNYKGRMGSWGSFLDLFVIMGYTALWVFAMKRLKAQGNVSGNIPTFTYVFCGTAIAFGVSSCIDPFNVSLFPAILCLLCLAAGLVFHIALLKSYSGGMRRYSIVWIVFSVLSVIGGIMYSEEPVEPDLPITPDTVFADNHIRSLEEIHADPTTIDWGETVQDISLISQMAAFCFFVFSLTEGAQEDNQKRKIITIAISFVIGFFVLLLQGFIKRL